MSISFRRALEWSVGERSFRLVVQSDFGELHTPDGEIVTMTMSEWHALSLALLEVGQRNAIVAEDATAKPPRSGRPWSSKLDDLLTARWNEGADVRELSEEFGRSPKGISARLVRLGLVASRYEARSREPVTLSAKHSGG